MFIQPNTAITIIKKGSPIAHAVLIYKIENDLIYIKNSYWDEPEIQIPVDRMTYFQSLICDNARHDFGVPEGSVFRKFYNAATDKASVNPKPGDWMIMDEGYFLTMTRLIDQA